MTAAPRIGVIGAGSWGTTLANLLAKKGERVTLWAYEADLVQRMNERRENELFLPGITLSTNLSCTNDLSEAVSAKDFVVVVTPSQVMRKVLTNALASISPGTLLISASKGIENDSLQLMSEVLDEIFPRGSGIEIAFLSGPSFAREVAKDMPTAVVAASKDAETSREVQHLFSTDMFRVYTNGDIVGVELGGSVKNVMAIAAGVSDGLGFGSNTRAALITRGLAEMTRLGITKGAVPSTFAGLAGMGDLVLTCTGDLSRNRTVGMELGKGRKLDDILSSMKMVAEGVKTTLSTYQLSKKLGVEMPIVDQMYQILYENKDPLEAVSDLMTRELKSEEF